MKAVLLFQALLGCVECYKLPMVTVNIMVTNSPTAKAGAFDSVDSHPFIHDDARIVYEVKQPIKAPPSSGGGQGSTPEIRKPRISDVVPTNFQNIRVVPQSGMKVL